MKLLLEIIWS